MRRRVLGEHHPNTLVSACNLVSALLRQGKNDEAEGLARELLEVCRRVLGDHHPNTLVSAGNLVTALFNQGKNAEADALKREFNRWIPNPDTTLTTIFQVV